MTSNCPNERSFARASCHADDQARNAYRMAIEGSIEKLTAEIIGLRKDIQTKP
jgi:hypothetical protein